MKSMESDRDLQQKIMVGLSPKLFVNKTIQQI